MLKFGFVILSFNMPMQVLRLTKTLSALYDSPPIICHHNFNQSHLNTSLFSKNVKFINPHINTEWGHISTVKAGVLAVRNLYKFSNPDWFFVLSGSDYPLKSALKVSSDLINSNADVHIDLQIISKKYNRLNQYLTGSFSTGPGSFSRENWSADAYLRYSLQKVVFPRGGSRIPLPEELNRLYWRLRFGIELFGGDPWYIGSRQAAKLLINSPNVDALLKCMEKVRIPEEIFYQSFFKSNNIIINPSNFRYSNWPISDAPSPKWLTIEDIPESLNSGAHFGRKFPADSPALDLLDKILGI